MDSKFFNNIIKNSDKIIWSGSGHSYALSELFAVLTTKIFNKISIAVKTNELAFFDENWKKVFISQSGSIPNNKIDLLITQTGMGISEINRLLIESPYKKIPWFALDYFKNQIIQVSELFHINCFNYDKKIELPQEKKILLVFDKNTKPLKQFLQSTIEKIPQIKLQLTELNDIGHGYHQQIYNNMFHKVILCISNQEEFLNLKLWFEDTKIGFSEIAIKELYSDNLIINNFLFFINYLKSYIESFKIEYLLKEIPLKFDNLR